MITTEQNRRRSRYLMWRLTIMLFLWWQVSFLVRFPYSAGLQLALLCWSFYEINQMNLVLEQGSRHEAINLRIFLKHWSTPSGGLGHAAPWLQLPVIKLSLHAPEQQGNFNSIATNSTFAVMRISCVRVHLGERPTLNSWALSHWLPQLPMIFIPRYLHFCMHFFMRYYL